jgi:SAM-dependent methyltransferase
MITATAPTTETASVRGPLEDRYFTRMAAAVDEKSQILTHLAPGTVVDIGAGGGELATQIARHPAVSEVFAYDNSLDAIRRLHAISEITTVYGGTERLAELGHVDNIVFSSVLHEIYSYAPVRQSYSAESCRRRALALSLQHAVDALAPGGRLIIRDFVLPDDPDAAAWLITPDDEADRLVYDYLERAPFSDLRVLNETDEHVFGGTRRSVSDALLTLCWGEGSLPRESQERYGVATLDEFTHLVTNLSHDIELVEATAFVQAGYREHLEDWACWTKALWVFQKKSAL